MLYIVSLLCVICGVALDQYTKYLATTHLQDKSIPIIEGVFQLYLLPGGNTGGAWGILGGHLWLLILVSLVATLAIIIVYMRLPRETKYMPLRICLVSITIGAIGNLIDRILYGSVIDFLYFELINFPVFNVADIFASVATCVLIVLLLFYYKEQDFDTIYNTLKWKARKKQESRDE